jgi:hypothetical protein
MIDKILQISKKELNRDIDYSKYIEMVKKIPNYQGFFFEEAGKEHYRLLSYISSLYDDSILIDIGTYQGFSALALGYNQSNKVLSYDIIGNESVNILKDHDICDNIKFKIENILNNFNIVHSSPFIILDTAHDGDFENIFINKLTEEKWSGILLIDDILEYPALFKIWNSTKLEKYELTSKGHWSGTGAILFNGNY